MNHILKVYDKDGKVMDKKEVMRTRYKLCSILLLIVITASCRWELSPEQLKQMRESAYQVSIHNVGYDEYWSIYNALNDSVKTWAENELGLFKYFNRNSIDYGINYRIDSLLCFNKQKSMCFTGISKQSTGEDSNAESVWIFLESELKGNGIFFDGAGLTLPRDFYQKENQPLLSFEKIKELAMKHLYYGYVRKSKDGEWYINDAFFNKYYYHDAENCPITTEAERDSSWLRECRKKWSERNKKQNIPSLWS